MTTALVIAFALAAVGTAGMAADNWRRRRGDASAYLTVIAFMGFGVALMNGLNAVHVLAPSRAAAWIFPSIHAVVSGVVVSAITAMSLTLTDRSWRLSRRTVLLLAVEPALMVVSVATNPWLHLHFTAVEPTGLDGMPLPVPGPGFFANLIYQQLMIWGTMIRVLFVCWRATSRSQRTVCGKVLGSWAPPVVVGLILQALPPMIDIIPLGQAITMVYIQLVLVAAVPRQIPVAHRQVFAAITDAVTVVDRAGRILEVNPAADSLLHRLAPELPADLTGTPIIGFSALPMDERETTEQTLADVQGSGVDLHLRINPLRGRRDACIGWAVVGRDVTDVNRRRREAERTAVRLREQLQTIESLQANLAEQAVRDVLTGLHNRRYLMDQLTSEVSRASRDTPLSLAIVDLDHFKQVNDTYGHGGGDEVLVSVAQLLGTAVRPHDIVARYGGEEFVIVFSGAGADAAWSRIDSLRERLASSDITVDGHHLSVSFSAGVSELRPGDTIEDLLHQADEALYEAKRRGRNRVELAGAGVTAATPATGPATGPATEPATEPAAA